MSIQWTRRGVILFFILFVLAMIWPGMVLGNRTFPLVLGLPFAMVWIASWVIFSFFALVLLDWVEGKAEADGMTPSSGGED